MSWEITYQGNHLNSDDFTLDELEAVEKASGVPWSILNAYREVRVAKALLAVLLVRLGQSDAQMTDTLTKLTMRDIKNVFTWIPEDGEEKNNEVDDSDPLEQTNLRQISPNSSTGVSGITTGPRKKRANSA